MKCEICGMENAKLRVKDLYYHKKCLLEHEEKREISKIRERGEFKEVGTKRMKGSKYIALVGAILGILAMVLFYLLPEIFCLWRIEATGAEYLKLYLGGFYSMAYSLNPLLTLDLEFIRTPELILLIVSILIAGGFVITLIGGLEGKRNTVIGGGVVLLFGPILFMIALLAGMGTLFGELASTMGLLGQNLLFGSLSAMGTTMSWGLGPGFFVALAGGILGVIGGALMERE
ncbi:MAG: hypothetical protein ACFFDX_15055 [Candidatus Odinarchaeota archaeon]